MPANLSPEYLEAEKKFKAARTPAEKTEALEEMLATIPKHKGTEKMQADLKRRLSKLRAEAQKKGGTAHALPFYQVEKEGAGQLALVGAPNTGKSLLLRRLTHATPEVADYPFTTRRPTPGMMRYENVQFQLLDLPPISAEFTESWLPVLVRQADGALLVVDLASPDLLEEIEKTRALLEEKRIWLAGQTSADASRLAGTPCAGAGLKPTLLVANKLDLPGAADNFSVLRELLAEPFPMVAVSAESGAGLDQLRRAVFELMGIVRVYTKAPGKKSDRSAPYVLRRGSTAFDVAAHVHKDIAARLKFARIWGAGKYEGQMVERNYLVEDGDVIEFHTG